MARKKNPNSPTQGDPLGGYFEVRREVLAECLALLKTVLVKRASRKDLASVHFEVKPDGRATVAGTDMEIGLQLKLPLVRQTGVGRVMIDSHALDAVLGAYHEMNVRVHLDDPKVVRVEGTAVKLKLPGYDPGKEMKRTAPGSLTPAGWIVRADVLESAVRRTRFAADLDGGTRYALGGLALHFPMDPAGTWMGVVGCDGRRLSVVRVPVRAYGRDPARTWKPVREGAPPNEGVPVVPNKAVTALLRVAKAAGDTSLGLAVIPGDPIDLEKNTFKPGRVQAVTHDAVLTAQLPEGRYPNWREVFPSERVVAEFRVEDATRLRELLGTAVAALDSEHKGVEFTMAGGCIMIESESEAKGKTQVFATGVEMTGRGTAALDGLMLRQFFDVIGNERLQGKFYGPKAPMVFHAGPDHDFLMMPLTRDDRPAPRPVPASEAKPDPDPEPPQAEGDGDGNVTTEPPAPEPPVPVGATPEAHKGNGKAKAKNAT